MGLAAPRKKIKLSHDPNNTNWARSTSGFGHKILSSQGWTPGNFLGARNAAHADMFTAASASHIRVIVKDDTLGLGARSKRDPLDEPTGLDAFKGLLGRLNGKSDADLESDQQRRDTAKLARYAATKWQAVTFISGGLLSQEKIDPLVTKDLQGTQEKTGTGKPFAKNEEMDMDTTGCLGDKNKSSNKETDSADESIVKIIKSKKGRHDKKASKRKNAEELGSVDSESRKTKSSKKEILLSTNGHQEPSSSSIKPSSKERLPMGRHVFRGRHIAQKKKALMDEKSLNEIFMVRS
ncbi:hypothetical protein BO71DRAFT_374223 [Aspergillus ellipticus CBS 707.79]|uniref:Protein PXR1 n=1 Tax=Aspergillus ellipticus CBS 707.79 TaxID=1448320 RepID=A0A319E8I8_9EURO|nr:hypothetical protein BO71DRAFT_374223 [Aspergillus ellipticus CBS 707.79]